MLSDFGEHNGDAVSICSYQCISLVTHYTDYEEIMNRMYAEILN